MDQPPRNTRGAEPPGEEPFPQFEPGQARRRARRGGEGGPGAPGQANPWLVGLAVAVVLGAVSIVAFGLLSPDRQAASPTSTTSSTSPAGSSTTGGDGSTTTGGEGTSTTNGGGTAPTTSLPDGSTPPITPVGEAIPIAQLQMTVDGIGILEFGADADQVLGRLAATFGEPTQDTGFIVGDGSWGECAGDSVRIVQWGPLSVVAKGEPGNSRFVSYRLDLRYGGITSPTTDIATRSGLRVGDRVGQLKETYSGFAIEFVVDAGVGLVFELREGLGEDLLLWGPVESQDDDALVTGIYSPNSCGRF